MRSINLIFLISLAILAIFVVILVISFSSGPSGEKMTEKAIQEQNISYCAKIEDKDSQNLCYFNMSDYIPEACNYMQYVFYWESRGAGKTNGLQLECYKKLFKKNPSEQVCADMDANLKGDGRSWWWGIQECFEELGYSGVELCNKFKTVYIEYWSCFVNGLYIPLELNETQCIEFAKFSEENRWRCYGDLAEIEKNEEFCYEMYLPNSTMYADDIIIDACIRDAAIAKKDLALCDELPSDCYDCDKGYTCQSSPPEDWNCKTVRDICLEGIRSSS